MSTLSLAAFEEFVTLLRQVDVAPIVDVRAFPRSRMTTVGARVLSRGTLRYDASEGAGIDADGE